MFALIRNICAVVVGGVVGSIVNMAIVIAGMMLIPLPDGVDMADDTKLAENIAMFEPINFLGPWLAHAGGTFVGAWIATIVAASFKRTIALVIGCYFLLGGILMVALVGGPNWFIMLDLGGAYIPMALLGAWLGGAWRSKKLEASKE